MDQSSPHVAEYSALKRSLKSGSTIIFAVFSNDGISFMITFDPSFTGESGGEPRFLGSPEINTEDFSAAVDYLSTRPDVDPERIGIIGICGFGGMGLNSAAIDTRIKATVISTMYDMSRQLTYGYFDKTTTEQRYELREQLNAQRTADYKNS